MRPARLSAPPAGILGISQFGLLRFQGPIYVRGGATIRDINGAVCISLLTNHGMSQMPRDSNFMQNGTRRHPSSHLAASEP